MLEEYARCRDMVERALEDYPFRGPGMLTEALAREAGIEGEIRMLITRTGLFGRDENGELVPLERL